VACCAWDFTPSANWSATTRIDKRKVFFIARLIRKQTYHARGDCGKDYLHQKNKRFVEAKTLNST